MTFDEYAERYLSALAPEGRRLVQMGWNGHEEFGGALATGIHHIHLLTSILIDSIKSREPDFVIGDPNDPYLIRWWLRRDRAEGSIYLHQIRRSDDDRALHDHPWPSTSIILLEHGETVLDYAQRQNLLPGKGGES